MGFWSWALQVYARPGVSAACLELQDQHGQSVPYLLWAAWAALDGRALDTGTLTAAADLAMRWDASAVAPLRAARRRLKPDMMGIPEDVRDTLRGEVKALELKAERILMAQLEMLAPPAAASPSPPGVALAAAAEAWIHPAAPQALERLAQTLC
jgi:uncharacterized protein (TIGR02444 family)